MRATAIAAAVLAGGLGPAGAAAVLSTETAKITASDGSREQFFGRSVALHEGRLLVGADGDGQNGRDAGAAYVFRRSAKGWEEVVKLLDPDPTPSDRLGTSVCFTADGVAAVSAPGYDVPGLGFAVGTVHLFDPEAGWARTHGLIAPPISSRGASFGSDTDCSGNRIIGGSPYENGTFDHEGSFSIFAFDGSSWRHEAFVSPVAPRYQGYLGWGVAIDGEMAVASGPGRDPDSLTIYRRRGFSGWLLEEELGTPGVLEVAASGDVVVAAAPNVSGEQPGVVSVYRRSGGFTGVWTEEARLQSDRPHGSDDFGIAVALEGDLLVVGERRGDQGGPHHGAAHVFRYDGEAWVRERVLVASDGFELQLFGASVAIEDRRIAVGAYFDDERAWRSGAVYEFRLPLRIDVDLWPYRETDLVAPGWSGLVAVALHGSPDFDPGEVDEETLAIGPAGAPPRVVLPSSQDLNGDAFPDRVALFRVVDAGIAEGDAELCLSGATRDGDPFEGCTPIETIAWCGRGHALAWVVPLAIALRRRERWCVRRRRRS